MSRFARLFTYAAVFVYLLTGCAQTHTFSAKGPAGETTGVRPTADVYLPGDSARYPVVFVMHHCDGVSPHEFNWARRLNGWGYAAVVIDSFGPRGFRSVCTMPGRVTSSDRLEDLKGALIYFRDHPRLDVTRAAVIGFSHGGNVAVKAAQPASGMALAGLRTAIAYYPACDRRGEPENPSIPILVFGAERDTWTPAIWCKDYDMQIRNSTAGKQSVRAVFVFYPQALHAFDFDAPYRVVAGHAMAYDPEAARDSFERTRRWLDEFLAH